MLKNTARTQEGSLAKKLDQWNQYWENTTKTGNTSSPADDKTAASSKPTSVSIYDLLYKSYDYDEIIPGLYLSSIPRKEGFEIFLANIAKSNRKLGCILSTITESEYTPQVLSNKEIVAMSVADAKHQQFSADFDFRHLPIQDRTAHVDLKEVKKEVDKLHQVLNGLKCSALVHCKAGMGRSAMIVLCYILKYVKQEDNNPHTIETATAFLKSKRRKITLTNCGEKIREFYQDLQLEQKRLWYIDDEADFLLKTPTFPRYTELLHTVDLPADYAVQRIPLITGLSKVGMWADLKLPSNILSETPVNTQKEFTRPRFQ